MNPHTPHPDEDPNASGRPDSSPGTTPDGSPESPPAGPAAPGSDSATGHTAGPAGDPFSSPTASGPGAPGAPGEAPPLYRPGGPYPAGPGSTPPASAGHPQNFFDWIRSHGIHRGRERWIGGVASGIAQRFGVDPLIVRGILIVLTVFAGVGVLLYGLAWALLPEPDGRIHVQEAAAGRWSSGMTGALITTLLGFPGLGGGVWGWSHGGFAGFAWTVFWVGGAIYLIYYLTQRNKARHGGTPMYSRPGPGWAPAPGAPTDGTTHSAYGQAHPTLPLDGLPAHTRADAPAGASGWSAPPAGAPQPPAGNAGGYGGGYGAGGYGGGAYGSVPPVPAPAPKPRHPGPGAPAVAIAAGLALLVGGGIKALDAAHAINLGTAGNAVVWASGAAVLGLGIVVSGLRGRSAGILGFFAVVALIIGGIFNLAPNADRARFQHVDWSPTSLAQAADGFDITGGSGTVDLTQLNLTPPLASDVVVRLDATASNVTVAIPANVPVQVQADLTMGNLNDGGGSHGGMTTQHNDYNTDKPGGRLIVKVSGTLSNITVKEGN